MDSPRILLGGHLSPDLIDRMRRGGTICVTRNAAGAREVRAVDALQIGLRAGSLTGLPIARFEHLCRQGVLVQRRSTAGYGLSEVATFGLCDDYLYPIVRASRAQQASSETEKA